MGFSRSIRWVITSLLIAAVSVAYSQPYLTSYSYGNAFQRGAFYTSLLVPYQDTLTLTDSTRAGGIVVRPADKRAYFNTGSSWVQLSTSQSDTNLVPYTGATKDVNLDGHNILANSFELNNSPTGTLTLNGQMYWDAANVCVSIPYDSVVTLQVGEELYTRARNSSNTTAISNGQIVYINGSQGSNPTITLAQADSVKSSQVLGMATEDIPKNATGFVTTYGVVNGINTSGFAAGDVLYLDTAAGGLTNSILPSPHNVVSVGVALNSQSNGRVLIKVGSPLASDTTLTINNSQIAPTEKAVKTYVDKRVKYTDTALMLSGYVRTVSSGNLSPVFTSTVGGTTQNPAISYSLSTTNPHTFFGGATSGTVAPTYRNIDSSDLPAYIGVSHLNAGTSASSATFWRGDGAWSNALGSATATTQSAGDSSTKVATTEFAARLFANDTGAMLSGYVRHISVGSLSPVFTSTVGGTIQNPVVSYSLSTTNPHTFFGGATSGTVAPTYRNIDSTDLPTNIGIKNTPTAAVGTNTTQIANTSFVATSFAPIASPTLTGTPIAPTAVAGTNTTQIATTAFVIANGGVPAVTVYTITETTKDTLNGNNGTVQQITLTNANDTLYIANLDARYRYELIVTLGSASRVLYWGTTVKVAYGGAGQPPQSTANGAVDRYFVQVRNGVYYVDYALGYN